MATTTPRKPKQGILRDTYFTSPATGVLYFIDADGKATPLAYDLDEEEYDEGPTCSLCDGLGHGYPGGGPCPLEERGGFDPEEGQF